MIFEYANFGDPNEKDTSSEVITLPAGFLILIYTTASFLKHILSSMNTFVIFRLIRGVLDCVLLFPQLGHPPIYIF
jgi:hypothetical protein